MLTSIIKRLRRWMTKERRSELHTYVDSVLCAEDLVRLAAAKECIKKKFSVRVMKDGQLAIGGSISVKETDSIDDVKDGVRDSFDLFIATNEKLQSVKNLTTKRITSKLSNLRLKPDDVRRDMEILLQRHVDDVNSAIHIAAAYSNNQRAALYSISRTMRSLKTKLHASDISPSDLIHALK